MRLALVPLVLALLLVLTTDLFAVFPSHPVLGPEGKVLSAKTFVEQPRLAPGGKRFMAMGQQTIVVILVEFPRDSVDDPTTAIVDTCEAVTFAAGHDTAYYNGKIFSEQAGSHSMDEYWDECSLGNIDITGIVLGPYTMPHCMKYYGWDTQGTVDDGWTDDAGHTDGQTCIGGVQSGSCRLIADALSAADPDIDYCQYDTDMDTNIDHVMIVHAGQGQEAGNVPSYTLWSYFYWGLPYGPYDASPGCQFATGVMAPTGFIVPEYYDSTDKFPLGTFCHEFSHSIGNPDLYDPSPGFANVPDDNDYPVSDWCLMDHGSWCGPTGTAERPSHLCAFNKIGEGWVNVTVVPPTQNKTSYTIYDLETAAVIPQGNNGQVLKIVDPGGMGDYWLIENRDVRDANTNFDKYDSDWSDWTGHGGPDSLDCGLIISHVLAPDLYSLNMGNNGFAAYDYVSSPACSAGAMPYELWVEDPGYDDRVNADYNEWWYPWEMKAGAAYADSSSDDPHYLWNQVIHANANCTRTASSIDAVGAKVTNVSVEATSDCATKMTADIFVPGWVPVIHVIPEPHFCTEWSMLHHDIASGGWTYGGGIPVITSPFDKRMNLKWTAAGSTYQRSSPVVTNTKVQIGPGDTVTGLVVTSSENGYVYCYSAADGRPVWSTNLGVQLRSTPIAADTLYGRGGVSVLLNRVYVSASNNRLYYLSLLTGSIQGYWPAPAGNALEAAPRIAMVENPSLPGNFVPLVFVGSTAGNMYALNATGPSLRWQYAAGSGINCPVAMGYPQVQIGQEPRVDAIFFGDAAGNLRCVRAYDGYFLWARTVGPLIMASPVVCDSVPQAGITSQSDETVIVATGIGRVFAMDATTGNQLWYYDTGTTNAINSSPSAAVDRAYNWGMVWFESTTGTVYCIHLGAPKGTSRLIWSYSTGVGTASSPGVVLPYGMLPLSFDRAGDPIYPPEGATGDPARDGVVYLGCGGGGGGRIIALDAANGTLVWDHTMAQSVNSSPAPTLGRLYVSADMLYCFVPDEAAGVG
ncbi:MAG TPA: M6 family metalloprotease domain-containing protein, partial [bacterium]|nr:M6 family metalloprotease domain-containing protein [bacterium]